MKVVWYFCTLSQSMIEKVNGLRTVVIDVKLHDAPNEMRINGKAYPKNYARELILYLLKFDGFTGDDYFHLDKPLITSVMATFVTYLIILIQFKLA